MIIGKQIMKFLEQNKGKHYTIKQIQSAIQCENKSSVWRNLKTIIKYSDYELIIKTGERTNHIKSYYGVRVRGVNKYGR